MHLLIPVCLFQYNTFLNGLSVQRKNAFYLGRQDVQYSPDYKKVVEGLKEKDVLGFGSNIVENKEIFMLAVALGPNDPTQLKKKDGLSLYTALKTADKALIASVLLGTASDSEDVDAYANFDAGTDLCEQCAESGYNILLKKYSDAGCDEELFERRLIKDLELLYAKNVGADI